VIERTTTSTSTISSTSATATSSTIAVSVSSAIPSPNPNPQPETGVSPPEVTEADRQVRAGEDPAVPSAGQVRTDAGHPIRPADSRSPVFEARNLVFRYPGSPRPVLDGVDVVVPEGVLYAILGPNGSGKSTLLRLLLGALAPNAGEVRYGGRAVRAWPRRELAARVGVVPQAEESEFPLTVGELVALGRYPHLGALRQEGPEDRRAVAEAMVRCDVAQLADRPLASLSGGERQRARIARALAQEPRTLVLDEPTASLDIRHEMQILELAAALAAGGVTVVLVTHAINLAARYADRLLLLAAPPAARVAAEGRPAEVVTRERIAEVYAWPVEVVPFPGPGRDAGAPQVIALSAPAPAALARVPDVSNPNPTRTLP
jgi:iron complex transport system ATP-binding protein